MIKDINLKDQKIIDITLPLHPNMEKPTPSFNGFQFRWDVRIEKGEKRNRSSFSMESHLGTHLDAPLHFIPKGKTLDEMPLSHLIGKAQIIDVPYPGTITEEFLISELKDTKIILFKFGKERLDQKYPYFSSEGVNYLLKKGIKVIGTDNYSVDSKTTEWKIHQLMLGKEIIIVEGLLLENVISGIYGFICLPLRIKGGEGSPVRALLFE